MKKNLHFLLFAVCCSLCCLQPVKAQKLAWAISVGDTLEQVTNGIATDKDGNTIITGSLKGSHVDFDPSADTAYLGSAGDNDIFVAKYNSAGQYLWAFRIGGAGNDVAEHITTDAQGNVYVSGYFRGSNVDFNPAAADTANLTSHGDLGVDHGFGGDAFLAKYSADGDYLWALNIGSSSNLDTGGDIAIDKNGDVLWTGAFTGAGVDFDPGADSAKITCAGTTATFLAKYTPSGQYLWAVPFTGSTVINSSGRKIKVDGSGNIYLLGHFDGTIDLNPDTAINNFVSHGCGDFFLAKLDSAAHYIWAFNLGGTNCDYPWKMDIDSSNNLYLCGFFSSSYMDFNPDPVAVNALSSAGGYDIFVAKYDSSGHYVFANAVGSAGDDMAFGIFTNPNGYTLTGSFSGTVDFNPSSATNNLTSAGGTDGFVARYDLNGNFKNCFRIGGVNNDVARSMATSYENTGSVYKETDYIGGYFTGSNVDFDPSASKLLLSSKGSNDIFIAKYTDIELVNNIKGIAFFDNNMNGVKDTTEALFNSLKIISTKAGEDTIISISSNGQFGFAIDTGTYVTEAKPYLPYYNAVPLTHTTSYVTYMNTDSISFALQPIPGIKDLSVHLVPLTPVRPGFGTAYKLLYQNNGTDTIASGTVELVKDSRLIFVAASPAQTTITGDTLRWNFTNLSPWDTASIYIACIVAIPPVVGFGDTLLSVATIYPVAADSTPADNVSALHQRVTGSFDPNDKSEVHGGIIKTSQITDGEYLEYTIRFQNTGNDTAFNINVKDTLSDKLDWSTLQMVSSSHNYKLTVNESRNCNWAFENINLVDSFVNSAASHGYIVYRIKPKTNLGQGDIINNTAFIYFDYNPAIKTNTDVTVVERTTFPLKLIAFTAKKNGKKNILDWTTANETNVSYFEMQRSSSGRDFTAMGKVTAAISNNAEHTYSYTDNEPLKTINYYRIKMVDIDGKYTYSPVRQINNKVALDINIYPNPAKNYLYIHTQSEIKTSTVVELVNAEGKTVLSVATTVNAGSALLPLNISSLGSGTYFINFKTAKEVSSFKFQKIN